VSSADIKRSPGLAFLAQRIRSGERFDLPEPEPSDGFDEDDFHGDDEAPELEIDTGDDPWEEERVEDDRSLLHGPRPIIELWMNHGVIEGRGRPVDSGPATDLRLVSTESWRLDQYVKAFVRQLDGRDIDLMLPIGELWQRLPYVNKQTFASRSRVSRGEGVSKEDVSERRTDLVRLPGGVVPLEFFLRREEKPTKQVDLLFRMTDLAERSKESVMIELQGKTKGQGAKYIGWVKACRANPRIVARHFRAFRAYPERIDGIIDDLAAELKDSMERSCSKPPEMDPDYRNPPLLHAIIVGLEEWRQQ